MRATPEAPERDLRPEAPGRGGLRVIGSYAPALAMVIAAFAGLAVLFLFPYVVHDYEYPIGWGAATYVAKARSAAEDGLALLGTVRAGGSVLLAVLMGATGESAFTLVAVVPALLTGVAGLGAAAMLRAALGLRAIWVPIIAFLSWAAFVENGILSFHFDNLVNAAFVLPALAAAVAFAGWGRGAAATFVLLAVAALSHWPFSLFVMAILTVALLAYVWLPLGAPRAGWPGRLREAGPLLAAAGLSGAVVGLSLVWRPPTGWTGVRLGAIASRLRSRFLDRLRDPVTYYPLPLAALGAVAVTARPPSGRSSARRLFLLLMASWVAVTAAAAVAHLAGITTAGDRLLLFFFPGPILAAVLLWWGVRWAGSRVGRAGAVAGAALAVAVVVAFGVLAGRWWDGRVPMIEETAVGQVVAAGTYLAEVEPGRQAVFLVGDGLDWWVTQATLPPDQLGRVFPSYSPPEDFLAGKSPRGLGRLRFGPDPASLGPDPVGILIEGLTPKRFRAMREVFPDRVVAPGVLVLDRATAFSADANNPTPTMGRGEPITAELGARGVLRVSVLVVTLLFLAGTGWAIVLLPPDPVVRMALAPALGAATIVVAALVWALLGLGLEGAASLLPLGLVTALGWGLAAALRTRPSPTRARF